MKISQLGKTDLKVSKIALGTMTFGDQNTESEAHEQLDYALDQGVNFIDTAEMYPVPARAETQGRTERYIGSWLMDKGKRNEVILASKITGPNRAFEAYLRSPLNFSPEQIEAAVSDNLERLNTDYIDLYQLHWPERKTNMFGMRGMDSISDDPWEENFVTVMEGLKREIDRGRIRYIGLSNETPWGVMKFKEAAKQVGVDLIASIQNPYSLVNRTYEYGMAEVSLRESIPLLAYSPMAFGLLSGKYFDQSDVSKSRLTLFPNFKRYSSRSCEKAAKDYVQLAKDYGLTPAQLSLAFVNQREFVGANIIGATTMEQLKENINSIHVELSEEVMNEINRIHQANPNPAP